MLSPFTSAARDKLEAKPSLHDRPSEIADEIARAENRKEAGKGFFDELSGS